MNQPELGDYASPSQGEARPVDEAKAVAGAATEHPSDILDASTARFPESNGVLELAVTQVDYTIEETNNTEYPVIHVFGRTTANDPEHVRILGVEPYFYVPTDTLDAPPTEAHDAVIDARETNPAGEPFESIRGDQLTKIITQTPRDVGRIRDDYEETYEADILFPNRFLIDNGIKSGLRVEERRLDDGTLQVAPSHIEPTAVDADLRVLMMDIEVDDRRGFPEDGEEPIVCLATHDSYTNDYIGWLYNAPDGDTPPPEAVPSHDILDTTASVDIRAFDSEEAMLDAFLEYVSDLQIDVMSGWNFEDFDAPYLLDRLEVLDMEPSRLSPVDEVWRSSGGWGGPDVKGLVVFDLLYAYQRTQFSELDSYRLDDVAEQELDVGKERYPGDIGDLWEQDPERLLEYNIRDVELCVGIDETQAVIDFWDEVRKFVGCKLEDATTPGDAVDMYVLHKAYGKFALPTKGQQEGEDFEGGAVFDPVSGVREMVNVLDLKSLYPMCMVTINASPETKVGDGFEGETYVAPNGQRFRKQPDGIIREMVDELLSEREEKKDLRDSHSPTDPDYERYDRQQAAVKVIMNCFTPDTEVLTPRGVQPITDLAVGDEVYSLDPDTMQLEIQPVVETHEYPDYRGELIDINTTNIDFRVTPNHRMLVRKNEHNGTTWDDYRFVEATELERATTYDLPNEWTGPPGSYLDDVDLTTFVDDDYEVWIRPTINEHRFTSELGWTPPRAPNATVGQAGYVFTAEEFEQHRAYLERVCEQSFIHRESNRTWIPRTIDGDDFIQLLGWFVTAGRIDPSTEPLVGDQSRGAGPTLRFAQDTPVIADGGDPAPAAIGALLDRLGIDYSVTDRSYQITSPLFGEVLADLCGENRDETRVPPLIWDLDQDQQRLFLDTLTAGDADWHTNEWRFSTTSTELRDDVLRLCAHVGLTASYTNENGSWRVVGTETGQNDLQMDQSSTRRTAEDGVYCVSVKDNQTLLAGRNGKFQFVGQSLYGVSGWERFRLYDKENAAAITATGREVIRHTAEAANELGYEVMYGDTDSVMLELGDAVSKAEAVAVSFDITDHINESYGEFASEKLNADIHRFQIEFEKLYRRFFQAGKKKRYAGHIVWKEGKDVDDIEITGFEYKRSDIAPITKQVQQRVLEMIVTGDGDEAELKEELTEYLHDVIERFQAGEVDLEEIGIPGGIGKRLTNYDTDTAHVRGAKYANLFLGTNFKRGSKPKRLYLDRVDPAFFDAFKAEHPELFPNGDGVGTTAQLSQEQRRQKELFNEFRANQDVICFEYADQVPDAFSVDYEEMLAKTLKGPIARVIEALDMSWEEVESGQEQTGLGKYM